MPSSAKPLGTSSRSEPPPPSRSRNHTCCWKPAGSAHRVYQNPDPSCAPGHRATHQVDMGDRFVDRPRRWRRRRRAASRPRSRAPTARRPAGCRPGTGRTSRSWSRPTGRWPPASTTTRSVPVSSRSVSATRNGRCRGVCSFSAKYVPPPAARLPYDVRSARAARSTRARSVVSPRQGLEVRARQLPLRLRPCDGLWRRRVLQPSVVLGDVDPVVAGGDRDPRRLDARMRGHALSQQPRPEVFNRAHARSGADTFRHQVPEGVQSSRGGQSGASSRDRARSDSRRGSCG